MSHTLDYMRRFLLYVCDHIQGDLLSIDVQLTSIRVKREIFTVSYRFLPDGRVCVQLTGGGNCLQEQFERERWDGVSEHIDLLPSVSTFLEWIQECERRGPRGRAQRDEQN